VLLAAPDPILPWSLERWVAVDGTPGQAYGLAFLLDPECVLPERGAVRDLDGRAFGMTASVLGATGIAERGVRARGGLGDGRDGRIAVRIDRLRGLEAAAAEVQQQREE